MSSFVFWYWGKFGESWWSILGKTTFFNHSGWCSNLRLVYKNAVFTHVYMVVFQSFTHTINVDFRGVNFDLLPTINTPYKDNNKLNIPILLLGGCV